MFPGETGPYPHPLGGPIVRPRRGFREASPRAVRVDLPALFDKLTAESSSHRSGPAMKVPPLFVGLDVGGTTMKAGVVDESGKPVGPPVSLPTEAAKGQTHGLLQMVATVKQAVAAARARMER